MGQSQFKFRAIVIDDVDFCRDLLTEFLEIRGYQVLTYPDVTSCPLFSARNTCCTKQAACADFLFLDNLMPHMTGLDFLELQTLANCRLSITEKVIFSGSWTQDDLERTKQLGCQFFYKPYDFQKLESWLSEREKLISKDRNLVEIDEVMGKNDLS